MKVLKFIYDNDKEIEFSSDGPDHIMVNATQMAKAFNKNIVNFLKTDQTKLFIKELENHIEKESKLLPKRNTLKLKAIENRGRNGMFFDKRLALKFGAWLNSKLEFWIFDKMNSIILGTYKKHTDATIEKIQAEHDFQVKHAIMMETNPEYAELMKLKEKISTAGKKQTAAIKDTTVKIKEDLFSSAGVEI